jgi:hypothetical protein
VLAHAVSRNLTKQYPDGLYVANFGAAGTARGAADIARDLLLQLGWPEDDMPFGTEDRVSTLRSLTRGLRAIFLFDAARDRDQVEALMPSEPGCLVIITSRRELGTSLGLPERPPVAPLSLHDALEMFAAVSMVDWTTDAETVVEVVQMCGRLPLAIQAAAERVRDGQDLRYVAASMRPARARLAAVDYSGRSIGTRIASEFERMDERLRLALISLSSIDSDSFVPWVLRPLMRLEHGESTALVAELAAAQFVIEDGQDDTGQARFRVHPLMRIYAMEMQGDARIAAEVAEAVKRFNDAYIELIDDVLKVHDSSYTLIRTGDRIWRTANSAIAGRIAAHLDRIVRREYLNLVRIIRAADRTTHASMIWRVAALLDGRTPAFPTGTRTPDEHVARTSEAFDLAVDAATSLGAAFGAADVMLAKAQFLVAVEHYRDATSVLKETGKFIGTAPLSAGDVDALRLRAARVLAWLRLEVGSYAEAHEALRQADAIIGSLSRTTIERPHVQTDIQIIRQLNNEIHRVPEGGFWAAAPHGSDDHDIVEFHVKLSRAEELRRRGYWHNAAAVLRELLHRDGDAHSHTSVHYRLALCQVDHALHLDDEADRRADVVREAIQHAAACIVTFGDIGDKVGQVRARALLVRALVLSGDLPSATQLDVEVQADLRSVTAGKDADLYRDALTALCQQAHAEVEIAHGRLEEGWASLVQAVQTFRRLQDWSNHADAWRVLHEAYRNIPDNHKTVEENPADIARDRARARENRKGRRRRPMAP